MAAERLCGMLRDKLVGDKRAYRLPHPGVPARIDEQGFVALGGVSALAINHRLVLLVLCAISDRIAKIPENVTPRRRTPPQRPESLKINRFTAGPRERGRALFECAFARRFLR